MVNIVSAVGAFFLDIIETVVIALSIFLVIYLFVASPHQVNGQSMVPTFQSGEYVLSDKISYRTGQPQRGDVIVFHAPAAAECPEGTGCDFIKRIIGLPGEKISVHDNRVYINDQPLEESYILPEYETNAGPATRNKSIVLQANEYFVSGDNRPYSSDSRSWGSIHKSDIVGKAFFRYWPLNVAGKITHERYAF